LLIKILDVQETQSLQVHPSTEVAASLGGEAKSELLYFTHSSPEAVIYFGLRGAPTRESMQQLLQADGVPGCFNRLNVRTGDAAFVPAGRVHAVGAGSVLFEIQQNSNTAFPVYEWNRNDGNGLHHKSQVQAALDCIDFQDNEPRLTSDPLVASPEHQMHCLVNDPLFKVDVISLRRDQRLQFCLNKAQILGMVRGGLAVHVDSAEIVLQPGQFCLIPACLKNFEVEGQNHTRFLRVQPE
jgi:mannose-6-phosphate isomerase